MVDLSLLARFVERARLSGNASFESDNLVYKKELTGNDLFGGYEIVLEHTGDGQTVVWANYFRGTLFESNYAGDVKEIFRNIPVAKTGGISTMSLPLSKHYFSGSIDDFFAITSIKHSPEAVCIINHRGGLIDILREDPLC